MTQNLSPLFIGIDVAKDKLDIAIIDQGKVIFQTILNQKAKIRLFFKGMCKKSSIQLCALESTGGHEKEAVRVLNALEIPVHVAHPNRVYFFAKGKGYFAKTDKVDALILANYARQEDIEPTPPKSESDILLRELQSRKGQLTEMLVAEKTRVTKPIHKETKNLIKWSIKHIESAIKKVEAAINTLIENCATKKKTRDLLLTFKCVGKITANTVVSLLPELGHLKRTELAALVGVAPCNNDSGLKRGKRHIKGGRFYVRKALYMASLSAIQWNTALRKLYARLVGKGKESKVALVAVMRKIILTLNQMVKTQSVWKDTAA